MSIGSTLPHDAAFLHVMGAARYVDDVPLPANALHLAFGLSQIANGHITSIDLSAVRAALGVVAVYGPGDISPMPDCSPSAHDEPLLAQDTVHYLGQPIFLVAATSHLAARKAVGLAKITYDERPAILTIEQALEANSRFEDGPILWAKGDVNAAIEQATHIISGEFDVGGQEHFYLEGQVALAIPQEENEMLVHSSTQHPSEVQHKVAHALGVPLHQVRVEVRRMGGGFGGKESQGNALAVACAWVAHTLGGPCKMRYDRDDDMMITGKRHDIRIHYHAGFDTTGKLTGVAFKHLFRCGWSLDLSLPVADRAMLHADNAYHLPSVSIESHRLRTNTQSATAFRGFGGPQGMIGIERVIDHIAHHLCQDPLQVRKANFYNTTGKQTTPYHMAVEDSVLTDLVQELETTSNYTNRRAEIAEWNQKNLILKRGIALTPVKFGVSFTLTHLNQAGALVHVYQDGSIALNHGGTEMGQGLFLKVAQVVASEFGVDVAAIKITATDTGKVPNTSATAASSGSDLNGMAAQNATRTIKGRMIAHLAQTYDIGASTIRFEQGQVHVGSKVFGFAQVAQMAYLARISLSSTGYYATPKITWDRKAGRGRPFLYFAYGAAVTEVVIDTLTGENRILRTDILHDTGKSLNPALDIGQIEGAYVQGAGWLTTEELIWDDKGRLRTHAPSTYKIPACSDRPDVFNVTLWDRPNPEDTVGRSKAVGEPPFMLGISAFFAISDAIAGSGTDHKSGAAQRYPALKAPATPENILRLIP
ncbi:MAG: xanthine dehydrogenase molybdopterin binding subunit, partial [Paracoccaceae bacterium]